jgi:hypothetical protein
LGIAQFTIAIQSANPFNLLKYAKNQKDETQTPEGLLKELKYFVSTSKSILICLKNSIIRSESKISMVIKYFLSLIKL